MLVEKTFKIFSKQLMPFLSAILLVAYSRYLVIDEHESIVYFKAIGEVFILSFPWLLGHFLLLSFNSHKVILLWLLLFILLPIFLYNLDNHRLYIDSFTWMVFSITSFLCFIEKQSTVNFLKYLRKLKQYYFSLNFLVLCGLCIWAIAFSAIFTVNPQPLKPEPLVTHIYFSDIWQNLMLFASYLWQFLILAGLFAVLYFCNRYYLIRQTWNHASWLSFIASNIVSIFLLTPVLAAIALSLPLNTAQLTVIPSENYHVFAIENYLFVFWFNFISLPIIIAFERKEKDLVLANTSKQMVAAELKLLQQQVNPHFLFNSLNSLYALTLAKSSQAPELLLTLANLLRYAVYKGQKERVNLKDEINYIQEYLTLQKIRFGERLIVNSSFPESIEYEKWSLAPLLLINILENAFKHGVELSASETLVTMELKIEKNRLYFSCENPFIQSTKKLTDVSSGVGLNNLKRRLLLQYPNKHKFSNLACNNRWRAELELELFPC